MSRIWPVSVVGGDAEVGRAYGLAAALERHPRFAVQPEADSAAKPDLPAELRCVTTADGRWFPVLAQRFQPAVRSARAAVASGRLGLPWNIQADVVLAGPESSALLALTAEPLDVVTTLLGLPIRRVMARAQGPTDAPHQITVLADHDKGATSTVVISCSAALAGIPPGEAARHRYRLSGSHGVLLVDATKPRLTVRTDHSTGSHWSAPGAVDAYVDAIAAELDGATGVAPQPAEAWTLAPVLRAVRESLRQGVPVPLDPAG